MAGGFVPFGQNLQLQGGAPLMKAVTVFVEKLGITKRLDGGPGLQGMMQKVLQDGNLSSVMQNPMAAPMTALQGQINAQVSQLQSMSGGGPSDLISALTGGAGLSNALGQLQASGDNLAGLTNGATGFFAMLGHANTADMAGPALPADAGIDAVTAPLTQINLLAGIRQALPVLVSQVVSGTTSSDVVTGWVLSKIGTIGGVISGSAAALAYGEQMHPLIATVSSVAGALAVPPTFDAHGYRQEGVASGFQGVLQSIVQPDAAEAMAASVAGQIAHIVPPPVNVAAITSLGDE